MAGFAPLYPPYLLLASRRSALGRLLAARAGRRGAARALHDAGGGMAGHQVDQDHLAAVGLDEFVAHHGLLAVVATLDEDAGPQPPDQVERRVVLEDRDEVDRFERRQ